MLAGMQIAPEDGAIRGCEIEGQDCVGILDFRCTSNATAIAPIASNIRDDGSGTV